MVLDVKIPALVRIEMTAGMCLIKNPGSEYNE